MNSTTTATTTATATTTTTATATTTTVTLTNCAPNNGDELLLLPALPAHQTPASTTGAITPPPPSSAPQLAKLQNTPRTFLSLPTEIHLLIADHTPRLRDLHSLLRTNRYLYSLLAPSYFFRRAAVCPPVFTHQDGPKRRLLHEAVTLGDYELVEKLLRFGAARFVNEPDTSGATCLLSALYSHGMERKQGLGERFARLLIKHGAVVEPGMKKKEKARSGDSEEKTGEEDGEEVKEGEEEVSSSGDSTLTSSTASTADSPASNSTSSSPSSSNPDSRSTSESDPNSSDVSSTTTSATNIVLSAPTIPTTTTPTLYRKTSPLHVAIYRRDLRTIRLLLRLGASATNPTPGGWTPLHLACLFGGPRVVKLLLSHGADPRARDMEFGILPAVFALHMGDMKSVDLLGGRDEPAVRGCSWGLQCRAAHEMILVVERIGWNEEWVKRRAYDRKLVAERRWEAVKYVRSAEECGATGGVVGRVGRFLVGVLRLKAEEEEEEGNTAC